MSMTLNRRLVSALSLATLVISAMPSVSSGQEMMKSHSGSMNASPGLDGYCPVCVVEMKAWEKGNPQIQSTFDGVAYYFPSDAIKAKFDANPAKYVPALNGDCIVCYQMAGKRVPGRVQHPALYNNRVYLFPSDKEKDTFKANPAAYAKTDLAADGECIVCLRKMNQHVPGSPDHTVIHDGLRYQFPSEREAAMFRQSPQQFVSKGPMAGTTGMKTNRMKPNDNGVRLVGRSGCAACEFGVKPLSSPNELGLAVAGIDGSVTVIEGAHKNYPQIYRDRFEGKQLAVEGRVIRTRGNISWLEPSSLMVLN